MNTPRVSLLLTSLAAELERPREITPQVLNHLLGTYNLARESVGEFLLIELPKLEDYEIDLLLSPLFTPTLNDQAVFADLLGAAAIPHSEWPKLVTQLVALPTHAQLITDDRRENSVPLRAVTIERFVHRLRLDAMLPDALFQQLDQFEPKTNRPLLKAIARRATWTNEQRREILTRYLTRAKTQGAFAIQDAIQLLKLVETYEPADTADLLTRIPHWQQVLRQEINEASGAKPFFNERVQDLHGGGRDQRRQDNSRVTAKENERDFLERLQRLLAD